MRIPEVEYARSGDLSIAYQVIGGGAIDIIFVRGSAGELLSRWEQPRLVRFVRDLSTFGRVFLIERPASCCSTRRRRGTRTDDYPWARSDDEWDQWLAEVREGWGRREFLERLADAWAPSEADDLEFRAWFVSHMRRSLSPAAVVAFFRAVRHADASDVMPAVRVPTAVLYSPEKRDEAAYTPARIPGAYLVELPGQRGNYSWLEDVPYQASIRATRKLVSQLGAAEEAERVLSTVLFTDIVAGTERAAQLGDAAWRDLLARHHAVVRRELARFKGKEVDTAGDGFFATFDGPARAIRCACAIAAAVQLLRLEVGSASTPASARSSTGRSVASRSTPGHASRRPQNPAKSSSRVRSKISSPAPGCSSSTAAFTS